MLIAYANVAMFTTKSWFTSLVRTRTGELGLLPTLQVLVPFDCVCEFGKGMVYRIRRCVVPGGEMHGDPGITAFNTA